MNTAIGVGAAITARAGAMYSTTSATRLPPGGRLSSRSTGCPGHRRSGASFDGLLRKLAQREHDCTNLEAK